ncbi:MAG: hypothetical protein ACI96V_001982 [Thalassolituus oleivorans]|jgi:hypothetical protein
MKFVKSLFILVVAISSSEAAELDDYNAALDWEAKWDRVIENAMVNYLGRVYSSEMDGLTEIQKDSALEEMSIALQMKLGWEAFGDKIFNSFMSQCGTEILDKMVSSYAGADFTEGERKELANSYSSCASTAMSGVMEEVSKIVIKFKEEKDRIIQSASK